MVKNVTNLGLKGHLKNFEETEHEASGFLEAKELLAFFKILTTDTKLAYTQLLDVCVVDYLGLKEKRFEVVYHLLSMDFNKRLRIKVALEEDESIDSATTIFKSALWWEREAFDMYGVTFKGHPNLTRILTDYNFKGHPMRKDFPLTGYYEVAYDPIQKKVVEQNVNLPQAYRTFDSLSPWDGINTAFERHQQSLKEEKQLL